MDGLDKCNGNSVFGLGECNDEEFDTVFKCSECELIFSHEQDDVYESDTCPVCLSGELIRWDI